MRSKGGLSYLGLATILGIAGVLAAPTVALASCAPPQPFPEAIRNAASVFVGTVVDLEGGGRWATVDVVEVWAGGELSAQVEVRGGPGSKNVATSVDRHYELSREYLFVPYERNGSVFRDSVCSRTTAFRPELNRFRPVSAGEPSPLPSRTSPSGEVDEKEDWARWLLVGAGLVGAAVIAVTLLRRR